MKRERIYVNKQRRPEKFLVAFSGKVFWLEFWSFESSFSADIRSIFVKLGDIVDTQKHVPDFLLFPYFSRYSVYIENFSRK